MMKVKSLKGALQIAVTVTIVVIGFAVSQFVTQRYSQALLESAKARAENIAHKLAISSADLILINDLVTLQKELDNQLLTTPAVSYVFIEHENRVIAHTFKDGIPSDLIDLNKPVDGENGKIIKIESEKGEKILDIAWPIFGGHAGILRLGFSERPYLKKVERLWFQISLITTLMIIAVLVIIHFLLLYLTRPLSELADKVERIDEGSLDTSIAVQGRQEVTKLAHAFNRMLDRIKEYTWKIKTSNLALAEKNRSLERAHKQLSTSIAISRQIAGLPKLHDICIFLFSTFREILTCKQMAFLVFSPMQKLLLITDHEKKEFDDKDYQQAYILLDGMTSYSYLNKDLLSFLDLPASFASAAKLTVFPMLEHDKLFGALIVGCREHCVCKKEELIVVEPILSQSAGAFQRALSLEQELENLNRKFEISDQFYGIIGKHPKMQMIYKLIENVASTDTSVLIQGESGTGKELVANAIHNCSPRKNKPFTIINCSAYPATLLESELFGHEKGAFTGATRKKPGRFEQADEGTIFLDEIGEISPSAQIKLLRVLQSRKFKRLGGEQTLSVNVRILAATNRDLAKEVQTGGFREDLYYRLNVIPVHMPPLRERKNDIFLLARHFLSRFSNEQNKIITGLSAEAMHFLMQYHWPGNVRELENSIEHAVVLSRGNEIEVLDLPTSITEYHISDTGEQTTTLSETEEELIRRTLEECNRNKSKTAEKIGISRGTLYHKIRKYNILN